MYSELNDAPTEGLLCVKEARKALCLSGPDLCINKRTHVTCIDDLRGNAVPLLIVL